MEDHMPAKDKINLISFFRNYDKTISQIILGFYLFSPGVVFAQSGLVGAGEHAPVIDVSDNNVPIVNINKPSTDGVSRNEYNDFNIGTSGIILNNSNDIIQTQIGGYIDGNAQLQGTNANIILNEVISNNPSLLQGYSEVAGQSAEVIIANQNGITCNGCGFINTTRGVLTTGELLFENQGQEFSGYDVSKGQIEIGNLGFNASNVEQVDILSRSIKVNGQLWADQLNLITGQNKIYHSDLNITEKTSDDVIADFSLDVAAIGGMYANRIKLVGTEKGLGVNLDGNLIAAEDISIDESGQITNNAKVTSKNIEIQSESLITQIGSEISAKNGSLNIESDSSISNSGLLLADEATNITAGESVENKDSGIIYSDDNLSITASDEIINNNGTIQSGSSITLNSNQLLNVNGALIFAKNSDLEITANNLQNSAVIAANNVDMDIENLINADSQAQIQASQNLTVNAANSIENNNGALIYSQNTINLVSENAISNDGDIQANSNITMSASYFENTGEGSIKSYLGLLSVDAQTIENLGVISAYSAYFDSKVFLNLGLNAQIQSQDILSINVTEHELENTSGATLYSQGSIDLTASGSLNNTDSVIQAMDDISIQADALNNTSEATILSQTAQLDIDSNTITNAGVLAANTINLDANDMLNSGSNALVQATQNLTITLDEGDLDNQNGGMLFSFANMVLNIFGIVDNQDSVIRAGGDIAVDAAAITNNSAATVSTQSGLLDIDVTNVNNEGLLQGNRIDIDTQTFSNSGSNAQIQAVTDLDLDVTVGNVVNSNDAVIYAGNDITINTPNNIVNQQASIQAGNNLTLTSNELSNDADAIILSEAGTLTATNNGLTNAGTIAGKDITLSTHSFSNSGQTALIQASNSLDINTHNADINNTNGATLFGFNSLVLTTTQAIENIAGYIQSAFNITLNALTLNNDEDASVIAQGGTLDANVSSLSNQGLLFANDVDIDSTNFSNSGQSAQIQAVTNLDINNSNHIYNQSGALIYSAGNTNLTTANNVYNTSSTVEAGGNLSISANTIQNQKNGPDESYLYSGNTMTLTGNVNNEDSNIQSSGDLIIENGGFTNNAGGAVKAKNGTATFDVDSWYNYGFIGSDSLFVETDNIYNIGGSSFVLTGTGLTFNAKNGSIYNTRGSLLYSFGGMELTAKNKIVNSSANIEAKDRLDITAASFENERSGIEVDYSSVVVEKRENYVVDESVLEHDPGVVHIVYENSETVRDSQLISEIDKESFVLSDGIIKINLTGNLYNEYSTISAGDTLEIYANDVIQKEFAESVIDTTTGKYSAVVLRKNCFDVGFDRICDGYKGRKDPPSYHENFETEKSNPNNQELQVIGSTLSAKNGIKGKFKNLQNGDVEIVNDAPKEADIKDADSTLADDQVKDENLPDSPTDDVTDLGSNPDQVTTAATTEDPLIIELDEIDPSALSADLSDTSLDDLTSSALFSQTENSDHNYLIETNPNFTEYENFISSDYMLEKMGLDTTDEATSRLGDGYLEQTLVRDQIIDLTGTQYINDATDTESQYLELMDNALQAYEDYELTPGVALTAEQIANLDQPIVWMVEQEFETENGTQTALVPKVYFTNAMQTLLREDGALIAADSIDLDVEETLANAGTIKAKEKLNLKAKDIESTGQLKAINQVNLIAQRDIINQSGLIEGGRVNISAGRDFINETKVEVIEFGNDKDFSAQHSIVGSTATINANSLSIFAGNDVELIGSQLDVKNDLVVQAVNDITVSTSKIIEEAINGNFYNVSSTEHITTEIGAGTVLMLAGNSFTAEGANIQSQGDTTIDAKDINLLAVKNTEDKDIFVNYGGGNTQHTQSHSEAVIGTQLNSSGVLRLSSAGDINSRGSVLTGTQGIDLSAAGNILLATEEAFNSQTITTTSKRSGLAGSSRKAITSTSESLTHTGTSLTSDGNIVMSSGNDISIIGSDVNAGQHIGIDAAGDLLVAAAVNQSFDQYTKTKKGSLTVSSKNIGSKTQEAVASNLNAGGSMSINSGGNVSVVGSNLAATDRLTIGNQIIAKNEDGQTLQNEQGQYVNEQGEQVGNVTVTTQELTNESWSESSSGLRGPAKDLVKGISVLTGTMTSTMGLDMEIEVGRSTTDRSTQTTQQASTVSANNLGIDVKGDVAIIGSDVNVGNIASINANSLTLDAAKETSTSHHSETVETISNSGPSLGENEITVGSIASTKTTDTTTTTETTWSGSTLNAGTLSVNTHENVNLISSDINVAGDTSIKAKDILIGGRQDTTETITENKEVIETVSLGIKNAYADTVMAVDALNDAKNAARDAKSAYDDAKQKIANGQMPASELKYFETNMVAATANVANATLAVASAGATAAGTTGTGGFYATGTASVETNESSSTTTDKTWNGSNLNIGGNANLQAENEIQVKGSNIAVTGGLQLDAKDIDLLAGENSSSSSSESSSHSESASYSTASGPSGSLSANESESTSESNYYTNTQITAGTLSSDSENLTLSGANVDAGLVDITTDNLLVESLQNTATSNSKTQGANIGIGGNGLPSSGGINQQASESSSAWVDQQSGITGGNVSIKAKDTTLKGGVIAAVDAEGNDNGQLSFATETLTVQDIQDHDTSSDKGFNLNTSASSTTVGASYSGHDTRQTTKATIGSGDVTVGGEQIADGTVNRDVSNSQEVTQVHELGGLDAEVTVDHRVFTDDGIKSIKKDFVDTTQHAKEIGQAVEDIATTDIGLVDGIKNVDKYANDRKVLVQKAMDADAQAALKGEEGAQGSEDELQSLSDALSKEEGLAENTDINLYDGSQTPDDTPVESANDFNKQEALAGYHENGEDGGNDIYLNIDKTDMTDSSDVIKSALHEQERHSQAQNNSSLSDTDQTTLATNRGEQAQDTFDAYSDLAGIDTKSKTTQTNWNDANRSSDNVVKATEQMRDRVDSEEVKPALPALAIPVIATSPEAVTAVAALATAVGLEIAEDDIKEFFGIEDTGVTVLETPIVEISPDETHTGGDQIVDQKNQPYTTPSYDDPVDQLLENIPEGVGNNNTELPIQNDLGIGLVFSERKSGVPDESFIPNNEIDKKYERPRNAGPTSEQKASVQNRPCVDCGVITDKQVADHIDPLVVEFYRDGTNDIEKQRQVESVQPHCPTCSSSQGGQLGNFGKKMKNELDL